MMMFLFPLLVAIVLAFWIRHVFIRETCGWLASPLTATLAGLALAYALALTVVCIDPTFDDNGSPEFIEWRFRWIWAAEIAGWLAVLIVPATLGLQAAAARLRHHFARSGRVRSRRRG